jgi:hypothetical protein
MSRWPHRFFSGVPPLGLAQELAADVRRAVFSGADADTITCDLDAICVAGGFRARIVRIPRAERRHEALLVPKNDGTFEILVDPLTERPMRARTRRHRFRFRTAHEIAHSFFYDRRQSPPQRDLMPSDAEEKFCNEFAAALLVPPAGLMHLAVTPREILRLVEKYEVSAQVVARAVGGECSDISVIGLFYGANRATGDDPGWRIAWSVGPRFVPANARLRSVAVALAGNSGAAERTEELNLREVFGTFHVAAALADEGKQMIVVLSPLTPSGGASASQRV